ncbi:MAG: M17 family peptidase N-terminal domain-containing protein [Myxococcales bacterium]
MRLSFADEGLAALDGLAGFDSLCLFVFEDERPLRGLPGYVDWRLCGGLSRVLMNRWFVGAHGDALLLPSQARLPATRIFCYGAGRKAALDAARFGALVRKACDAMGLAGAKNFATSLPPVTGLEEEARAALFLSEGAARLKAERLLLLGDGRALARAFQKAAANMKGLEVDKDPLGTTQVPLRPGPGGKLKTA